MTRPAYYSQDDESNAVSNNNDVLDIGVSEPRNPPPSIADRRRPPPRPQQTIEPFTGPQAEHRLVGLSVDEIYNAGTTTLSNYKPFTTLQSLLNAKLSEQKGFDNVMKTCLVWQDNTPHL